MVGQKLSEITGANQCVDRSLALRELRQIKRHSGGDDGVVGGDLAAVPGSGASARVSHF
ncbi:hypothetical protein D3C75_1388500 [compost metagenome]